MQQIVIRNLSIALFVALVTWGVYTLLVFYGIPVHGQVLLTSAAQNTADSLCDSMNFLCRGLVGFLPAVLHTIGRASPFLFYGVFSLIAYGAFLAWYKVKHGHLTLHMTLRPWHVVAIFVGLLWLLFTTLVFTPVPEGDTQVSFRRVLQPHVSIYRGDNPEGLEALQDNFYRLLNAGCLTKVRDIREGVGEYKMKVSCTQRFFVTRVLSQLLFLSGLFLVLLVAGRAILSLLRFRTGSPFLEAVFSFGTGVCAAVIVLWFFAVFGVLYTWVAWLLLLLTLVIAIPHAWYWIRLFLRSSWDVRHSWHSVWMFLTFLLLSYLALNFLMVVRPFPIGWDDLGSYLNRPRLLVSYGAFIYSMASFQWEYLSSLGYLLFGYESTFGSTAAMMINWGAGLFAVIAVLAFGHRFMHLGGGVLAALLYYTLPIIGHFSFADMKTDNAVFSFQALGVLALFCFLFGDVRGDGEHQPSLRDWRWLVLAGIFCAFAFGTKATAIMALMTVGAVLLGVMLHWSAFIGAFLLTFVVYSFQGQFDIVDITRRLGFAAVLPKYVFVALVGGVALLLIAFAAYKNRRAFLSSFAAAGIVAASFVVFLMPSVIHNNLLGWNGTFRLMQFTAPNTISPVFDYEGSADPNNRKANVRSLTGALIVDRSNPACTATGREEELGRYWGFREGWGHFLTLPWRSIMNIDSAGYYVTWSPSILLFPLLLLLPFFWMRKGRWLRWMFAGTILLVVQWVFLANGVPWYGIAMFLGLSLGVAALAVHAPDPLSRALTAVLLTGGFISCFAMRFWQFEQQRNLIEYPVGRVDAATMRERTIPYYDDITEVVLQRHTQVPDRPYLYRVGTFIPFFIPRNLEIIGVADHQLDIFHCLHQEGDNALTLQRLKALGFNSVIFDSNTATIERDPNGSLHQKVQAFVDFLNDPSLGLQVVVNDPEAGVAYILIP